MTKYKVPVSFHGVVEVNVPDGLTTEQKISLAKKVALSRIVASLDNPDAPEDTACQEYAEEFGLTDEQAEGHWDDTQTCGVAGTWRGLNP